MLVNSVVALFVSTASLANEKTYSIGADIELYLTYSDGNLFETGQVNDASYFLKAVGYENIYLQLGLDSINFQIGRFEAMSAFSVGKDTINHAGGINRCFELNSPVPWIEPSILIRDNCVASFLSGIFIISIQLFSVYQIT